MPLYISTGSKTKAFLFSFIASMFFMFVGAVIGYGILIGGSEYENFPNGVILSFAAGILFWMGIGKRRTVDFF
jgi:zinc transporter ZupT